MRIETLALKGILAFRDTLRLDLRGLPPGLVAIVGGNGEGKTTILETAMAATARVFPSRRGKELAGFATERDSFVETQFALDGRGVFRARVNLDGVKGGADAVLVQVDGGHVLNDGRVTTFDAAVRQLLPPIELLLASAFSAQNRAGNFIAMKPAARKDLFSALLGNERYEAMAMTAKSAAGFVEQARGRLLAVRDRLARDTSADVLAAIDDAAHRLQKDGGAAELFVVDLDQQIAVLDARLAMVADTVAAYQAATLRAQTLRTECAARAGEVTRIDQQRAALDLAFDTEDKTIRAEFASLRADLQERIGNNQRELAAGEDIRAAVARERVLAIDLANRRSVMERLLDDERALAAEIARVTTLRAEMTRAQRDASVAETVPCRAEGDCASCQFLTSATAAKAKVPHLWPEVEVLPTLEQRRDVLARNILEGRSAIKAVADEHATVAKTAARRERLSAAQGRIDELARQLDAIGPAEATRHTETMARYAQRSHDLTTQLTTATQARDRLAADLQAAESDLAATADDNAQAQVIQTDLAVARRRRDDAIATIARVRAEDAALQRHRTDIAQKRAELAELAARIATLDTELLDWQVLTKAFSRDGLPVLEIDAAGPTVSAYTNDLLAACFGPRFTVELVTQVAKADGKGTREDFTVRVYDNQRGGDRDIAFLSGGEQVVVSEALMNAISIYVNTRSPQPVRTCWRDETTGALDPENATRYLAMLRKVQELGGFHHVFFITHNPDAAALADAQIRVRDGRADIVLPPFVEAA
jgi:exonuclease SbcC